jgi:pyruvate-ferredoxin/flavodoxin oxidoreductase
MLNQLRELIGEELTNDILYADQTNEAEIAAQRGRVVQLKERLQTLFTSANGTGPQINHLLNIADALVKKNVWIVGGDGWAYDIGYGGLDHVLASGRNVNIVVLDTEVYSNTGGQMSKATPRGAVAKFAAAGKSLPKKDLGLLAISYGNVYVARVAFGANDTQTVKAFLEAETYDGPSIILAYSNCIAHGYDMKYGLEQQQLAVQSGYWPLYRYNPDRVHEGKNPFQLDSKRPQMPLSKYTAREGRYRMLQQSDPDRAQMLGELAQSDVNVRWETYERMVEKA